MTQLEYFYIHIIDWEFSSAKDYAGIRNGKLINKKVAAKYVDISSND